jgi:hypothetical protein
VFTAAVRGHWWEQSFGTDGEDKLVAVNDLDHTRIRSAADRSGRLVPEEEYLESSVEKAAGSFNSVDKNIRVHLV